jgi:hypothetical protein
MTPGRWATEEQGYRLFDYEHQGRYSRAHDLRYRVIGSPAASKAQMAGAPLVPLMLEAKILLKAHTSIFVGLRHPSL